ncbi:MAG: hypothetical protein MI807_06685 [Verrucomicrobiales bacterium]|nr:hypothetical protein [Verrucomicrobiales bacterium]
MNISAEVIFNTQLQPSEFRITNNTSEPITIATKLLEVGSYGLITDEPVNTHYFVTPLPVADIADLHPATIEAGDNLSLDLEKQPMIPVEHDQVLSFMMTYLVAEGTGKEYGLSEVSIDSPKYQFVDGKVQGAD